MKFTAKELAQILSGTVEGDESAVVTSFAKIEHGKSGQLCFYANPKYEQYVYTTKASILLVNRSFEPREAFTPTLIRVDNAYSAVAQLLKYVSDQKKKYRFHRGLFLVPCLPRLTSKIGHKVWLGNFTSIGKGCSIGSCTRIEDNVTIGEGCTIGEYCIIYPGVRIFPGTVIGDRVILHENCVIGSDGFGNAPQPDGSWSKIEHLGKVIIGNDVEIGSCTTVDRAEMEATIICDGVKIDNLCQIAHNVQIGKNTVMAALTGIAGSAVIGESCMFGGQVGINGHIKVADHTSSAAKALIIGNIRKSGQTLMGAPAIDHTTYLRAYAKFKQSAKE